MNKSPIEIAVGQTNILIEDEVCKAVGKVGIHINKEELLKALKAYEFVEELTNYIFAYPDDDYMTMECLCRKLVKYKLMKKIDGYYIADRKTEPQILDDIGRQIQDAYDKGLLSDADATQAWYEAVNKTEPQTITIEGKMSLNEWRKICPENPQFKDEPQTDCSWR